MIGYWIDGKMNGYYKAKNKNGITEGEFKNAKNHGLCAFYSHDHGVCTFGLFQNGVETGVWVQKMGHGKPF